MTLNVNDIIRYRAFGGEVRRVKVTEVYEDIKNGRPGFDGIEVDRKGNPIPDEVTGDAETMVWGYLDQII